MPQTSSMSRRADAGADAGRAGDRVGGGDERIGAVVDVEQRALGALEEDVAAGVERGPSTSCAVSAMCCSSRWP